MVLNLMNHMALGPKGGGGGRNSNTESLMEITKMRAIITVSKLLVVWYKYRYSRIILQLFTLRLHKLCIDIGQRGFDNLYFHECIL